MYVKRPQRRAMLESVAVDVGVPRHLLVWYLDRYSYIPDRITPGRNRKKCISPTARFYVVQKRGIRQFQDTSKTLMLMLDARYACRCQCQCPTPDLAFLRSCVVIAKPRQCDLWLNVSVGPCQASSIRLMPDLVNTAHVP